VSNIPDEKFTHNCIMSESPIDANKLRQFLAVIEHGNFGRAAESLGISQQATSKAIAQLEYALRVKLLERSPYGVRPTTIGQMLADRGQLAMSELLTAQAEIEAWRGARIGEVRIGVGLGFVGRIMPKAIQRFREIYPLVHVTAIVESSAVLYPMILRGELDFVVSSPPSWFKADPELKQDKLFTDQDLLIAGRQHPLARKSGVALSDLAIYPWLVSAQIGESWQRFCRQFVSEGLDPPRQLIRTDSIALAKELMFSGDYLCLLSNDTVSRELAEKKLVSINTLWRGDPRPAFVTYRRKGQFTPVVARMVKLLQIVCTETEPS
jgi:DNA-binding transcriptional LysR family regulator